MTNGWMWIIGIMLIGGFILQMTPLMFYLYAVFGIPYRKGIRVSECGSLLQSIS